MPAELLYSPQAVEDLEGIETYIAVELCNPQAARRAVHAVLEAVERLVEFPDMGMRVHGRFASFVPWRYVSAGNYMAFYRHAGGAVYVDRVLYAKSDYLKALTDDSFYSGED